MPMGRTVLGDQYFICAQVCAGFPSSSVAIAEITRQLRKLQRREVGTPGPTLSGIDVDTEWRVKLNHIVYTLECMSFTLQEDMRDTPDNWIFLVDFKKQGMLIVPFISLVSMILLVSCVRQ